MGTLAKLTSGGQVTLPKEIRVNYYPHEGGSL
ncbi:MAG: hypothetical protein DDT26_02466 [Dehalococcoidia bacterium]|nr:hypothetical protein [Chloroflexota bacterium]